MLGVRHVTLRVSSLTFVHFLLARDMMIWLLTSPQEPLAIYKKLNRIDLLREVARHLKDGKVFKTLDFGHTNGFKFQVSSFKVAMLLELSFGESYP